MRGRRKCPPKLKIEERFEWFARSRQVWQLQRWQGHFSPVITAGARQHETRRHEARQNARRQDDARRQRKDSETGKFHGKVHATSGRATVYQEADGKLVLRLTNFKTSNGPDVHVILVATKTRVMMRIF